MQAFFALAAVLLLANQANGFGWGLLGGGGGCGCAAPAPCAPVAAPVCAPALPPPLPPAAPVCAPQPAPVCPPPPPPPPPQVCPPPQPCPACQPPPPPPCPPPPPPPAPCPPPPPPQPCPAPAPVQVPSCAPALPPPLPAHNDCCNRCNSPCRFRSRRVFGAIVQQDATAMCNNDKLRNIMLDNINASSSESKRAIQKLAEEKLGGKYDVICATGEFSYVVHSNSFCQETLNGVTCYAFRH